MYTFCLVHGAWHDDACWELIVTELERRGHECVTPVLPLEKASASYEGYAEIFGDGLRDRAHRVGIAVADLQVLPLPKPVRDAVDRANNYLERLGQRRTTEIKAEWSEIHKQLMAAAELLH